jgi:DNA-binding PadR family transcriptional regulator
MGNLSAIGEFEQLIVLAVLRLASRAHAAAIRQEIESTTGRPVTRGAVYTTLDRLENKGYLDSRLGPSRPVQSGRPRRYYAVEPDGIEAIQAAHEALRSMWRGLEPVLGQL